MNMIIEGFTDLTRKFMGKKSDMSLQELKTEFIKIVPDFEHDKIFNDFIPSIYEIVKCEIAIQKEEKQ